MRNMIKAEWYRIVHSGILKWILFALVMSPTLYILSDMTFYKQNVSEIMILSSTVVSMMLPLVICAPISFAIGSLYKNRTFYYEIMNGYSTRKILLSKVILYVSIMFIGILVLNILFFGIMGAINGVGDIIDYIPVRFLLLSVIVLHIIIESVLLSTLAKKSSAVTIVILRFMIFDNIIQIVLLLISRGSDEFKSVASWFVLTQINLVLVGAEINTELVLGIVLSFIIECVLWYICSYNFYKK